MRSGRVIPMAARIGFCRRVHLHAAGERLAHQHEAEQSGQRGEHGQRDDLRPGGLVDLGGHGGGALEGDRLVRVERPHPGREGVHARAGSKFDEGSPIGDLQLGMGGTECRGELEGRWLVAGIDDHVVDGDPDAVDPEVPPQIGRRVGDHRHSLSL